MFSSFDIFEVLYYLIPVASLIFFAVSLFLYCYAKHRNKHAPGTYSEAQMKLRLIFLVISSVIFGLMAAVVVGFVILLSLAVAYM